MARTYSHIPEPRFVQKANEAEGGLPEIDSGDGGKVLTVNADGTATEWKEITYEPTNSFREAVNTVLGLYPDTLFDDDVVIEEGAVVPSTIVLYDNIITYPFNKWNVTVNGLQLNYRDEQYIAEVGDTIYLVGFEDGTVYFAAGNNETLVAGTYAVYIEGVYEKPEGIVEMSNLECSLPFNTVKYLYDHNYLNIIKNPFGQTAITITCDSSSFKAYFIDIDTGTAVLYELSSSDEITTTNYSTNISLTPLS